MAMTMTAALQRLEGVTGGGKQYYARCPAHADEKSARARRGSSCYSVRRVVPLIRLWTL